MTTSRERVLKAVNHQEPDRVPIDLGSHRSSGIMAIAYNKLKQHLGINEGNLYVYDMIQQLAIIEPPVLDRFGVDVTELGRGFLQSEQDWHDWVLPDGTPCKIPTYLNPVRVGSEWHLYNEEGFLLAVQREGCLYFEQVHYPLAGCKLPTPEQLSTAIGRSMWFATPLPPALPYNADGLRRLAEGASQLRASTDRAIVGMFGGNLLEFGHLLYRMDNFLTLMASEKAVVHSILDRAVEMHLENLKKYLAAVGPYIDIIVFFDDLGMQGGPQMSPRMYREYFQPREKVMYEAAKKLAGVKVMLHCCGGVYPLMRGLIEAGVDIIQPVQTSAKDMQSARLKAEFGKDICLWGGGCDTQHVLSTGTPEEVARDVRERVDILRPGSGFVFQQVHNIMADVPPANIAAMLDAVNS